jgi:hypothetical protein
MNQGDVQGKAQEPILSIEEIQTELAKNVNAAQSIGSNGDDIKKVF